MLLVFPFVLNMLHVLWIVCELWNHMESHVSVILYDSNIEHVEQTHTYNYNINDHSQNKWFMMHAKHTLLRS